MLLVFNVFGREYRTPDGIDIARAIDYADDAAALTFGTRPRGKEWVSAFVAKVRKLGYVRVRGVDVCTCDCQGRSPHSPECGFVKFMGSHPVYLSPPFEDEDLPLMNVPFEFPTIDGRRRFAPVTSPETVEVAAPELVPDVPLYVHGIPETDPDVHDTPARQE